MVISLARGFVVLVWVGAVWRGSEARPEPSTAALGQPGLPCRGEMQSCSANSVTLESTSAVTGLTGRITVEKENAKASEEPGLCRMDG